MYQLNQWHNSYSVYIKSLDSQHKRLIGLLNELYDAYMQNSYHEKVGDIILQLLDYASVHFSTEEGYFKECHYEEASEHIAEHQFFIKKIKTFEAEYPKSDTLVTLQIISFLQEWLHHHIINVDRKYMDCFRGLGLK
jgi:hemerythrin-like metal-binding protein